MYSLIPNIAILLKETHRILSMCNCDKCKCNCDSDKCNCDCDSDKCNCDSDSDKCYLCICEGIGYNRRETIFL